MSCVYPPVLTTYGDPPVGQGHAVEQAGQRGVYAEAPGAERTIPVRLAPRQVHRVEVIIRGPAAFRPARKVVVGGRHHEVSAVNDLCAGEGAGGQPGTCHSSRLCLSLRVRGVQELLALTGGTCSPFARHGSLSLGADCPQNCELSPQLTPPSSPFSPDIPKGTPVDNSTETPHPPADRHLWVSLTAQRGTVWIVEQQLLSLCQLRGGKVLPTTNQ